MTTAIQKVLVIGKSGQLANELKATAPSHIDLTLAGRNDLDILDLSALTRFVVAGEFDALINTSAYTAVDKAESEVEDAYAINQQAVNNMALACKETAIPLIHVSTDFVFGGESQEPWKPDDGVAPQGVYAKSKLAGEQAIQKSYPDNSVIVRTSWLYSTFGNNFVKTMLKVMSNRPELAVVDDQIGSPTYARGLAEFIWELLGKSDRQAIYHWSDSGVTSWHGFAEAIAEIGAELDFLNSVPKVNTTTTEAYGAPAPRPAYSVMDCSEAYKVKSAITWQENLRAMLTKLKDEAENV